MLPTMKQMFEFQIKKATALFWNFWCNNFFSIFQITVEMQLHRTNMTYKQVWNI